VEQSRTLLTIFTAYISLAANFTIYKQLYLNPDFLYLFYSESNIRMQKHSLHLYRLSIACTKPYKCTQATVFSVVLSISCRPSIFLDRA